MRVEVVHPRTGMKLHKRDGEYYTSDGEIFPIIRGVPRFTAFTNYTDSFGFQWNEFAKTQIDRDGLNVSKDRFFAETGWKQGGLTGENILEVGSGAGRFSKVVLEHTNGVLWSIDYSDAVSANNKNNSHAYLERFNLFQASVYEMPFPDNTFDKVFCLGVLQHTPDFEGSVKALISKTAPGGEIVVDFYPINGWWTKLNAKYLLRPFLKNIKHDRLLRIIDTNIDWLITAERNLHRFGLGVFSRFLPVVDIQRTFPKSLTEKEIREWAVLDTFDMFSPEYDNPQRIQDVASMFTRHGAKVTFSGFVQFNGGVAAVVRGVKVGVSGA